MTRVLSEVKKMVTRNVILVTYFVVVSLAILALQLVEVFK